MIEAPEAEPGEVVSAPETALVAAGALEVAIEFPPAELTAAVAPAEAGQLAADGSFTL